MINKELLREYAASNNIELSLDNLNAFSQYADILLEWNQKMNLTAIIDPIDIVVKHFIDSLLLLPYIEKKDAKLIDVGTGAGFPGVPLKIVRHDIKLTLLDSLNKRVNFLKHLSECINQDNLCIHGRAEEMAVKKEFRETYDYAVVRAVAPMNILCELCMPFVKPGGYFLACKGQNIDEELTESHNAIKVLGGELISNNSLMLPNSNVRSIIVIKKISHSSTKYPRVYAKIAKSPL